MARATDDKMKELLSYRAVYPQAPLDMSYHYYDNGILKIRPETCTLIESVEQLREYCASCEGLEIAVDTETTGLTYEKDFIVGFSVAKSELHGIYVPLRHQIKRVDEVEEPILDENGNQAYTKAGKARVKKVKKESFFENPANLPVKECLDLLDETMRKAKRNIMHNSEFDLTMIRSEGYDINKYRTFDTTILTYLYDSENRSWNKLKEASKIVLGRHPMKFAEALGEEENFRYVDLTVGAPYGASDALNTLGLYKRLYPKVIELLKKAPKILSLEGNDKPYNVINKDNELIRAFTDYYNRVDLKVNKQAAIAYKELIETDSKELGDSIFKYFDSGEFNLNPNATGFKAMMNKFNIVTGARTKSGKGVSYGKEGIAEMDRNLSNLKNILMNFKDIGYADGKINKRKSVTELSLVKFLMTYGKEQFQMTESANLLTIRTIEGIKCTRQEFFTELKLLYHKVSEKRDILKKIQKYSSMMKALNSYIKKLTEVDTCHMRYRLQGTASGRLSSGNGSKTDKKKNHYFIDLNAQNLTKPSPAFYKATKSDAEGNIFGWTFEMVDEEYAHKHSADEIIVEGSNPSKNIRNCFVAPEGRLIMSMDYSAQEYLVLAILSQDRKMIENFKNGIDPHTATAYAIWGEENYDRVKRKKAKAANFLQNYMGGPTTLAQNLNISVDEAKEIMKNYETAFFECIAWKKREINKCIQKQDCVCYTLFGRPRQFKSRISTASSLLQTASDLNNGLSDNDIVEYTRTGNALWKGVERRIVSHHIQSTCGDICRWDLIRLYRKFFKNRDPHVDFMTTVHDEINFTIDKEHLIEYTRMIDDIMTIYDFRKDLPIRTSIDLGHTLGVLFPFEWETPERLNLVPKRI